MNKEYGPWISGFKCLRKDCGKISEYSRVCPSCGNERIRTPIRSVYQGTTKKHMFFFTKSYLYFIGWESKDG